MTTTTVPPLITPGSHRRDDGRQRMQRWWRQLTTATRMAAQHGWQVVRMIMLGAARVVSWFAAEPARIRALLMIMLLAVVLGLVIGYGTGQLLAEAATVVLQLLGA